MVRQAAALSLVEANQSIGCTDVHFVFARGSGEPLGGRSMVAWRAAIQSKLQSSRLSYSFYELGSLSLNGYQYPAAAVSGSASGVLNLIGAAISGGQANGYGASVRAGIQELKTYVERIHSACPNTKFVLGGYSQGGQVVSTTLPELDAEQIVYAATFGDPKLYLPEGYGLMPAACLGLNYSNYREVVPNCRAYEGILGGTKPYQNSTYVDKLGVWCNKDDIMCSGNFSISAHTAYTTNGLYDDAATVIAQKISQAYPAAGIKAWWLPGAQLRDDVAFLFDTTGSMADVLQQYATEAKSLANQVVLRGGRIALYEYRDLSDPYKPRELCDFTCSYEEFVQKVDALTVDNGGDKPESALSALAYAMNNLNWGSGATKSLILVTDAGYHDPDRDGTSLAAVVDLSLSIDPVNLYILTEPELADTYQELAIRTGGAVFDVHNAEDLARSTTTVLCRPRVSLPLAEYHGLVGDSFEFVATAFDETGNSAGLRYDWDLDGDGEFEVMEAGSTLHKQYLAEFHGVIQVKVTDQAGFFSTMSARVDVYRETPPVATIEYLMATPIIRGQSTVNLRTVAQHVVVLLDDVPIGYLEAGNKSFVLTELANTPVTLTLVPYNDAGWAGVSSSVVLAPAVPLAPNAGVPVASGTKV